MVNLCILPFRFTPTNPTRLMNKVYPAFILSLFFAWSGFAQKPGEKGIAMKSNAQPGSTTGEKANTYALIIGISKYQNFTSLKYADRDAQAFYSYLVSGSGEKIDSSNIRLLLNENARAGDIWRDLGWLSRKAMKQGDRVFIYFSGHGDAANAEEAYLLAYDAPNEGDPNLYNAGGTFQIYNLKTKIKQFTAAGVQVILITDACRTNELPGREKGSQWAYNKIVERSSGEIQMTSCASNEKSLESDTWGNGRGVFSWHLINGLYGLADDDPEDGNITLYELQRYVKSKVRTDTKFGGTTPQQNPMFCCNDLDNFVLCKADAQKKTRLLAELNAQNQAGNSLMAINTGRSGLLLPKAYTASFNQMLEAASKEIVTGNSPSAAEYHYLWLMKQSGLSAEAKSEIKEEYIALLVNFAQQRINNYLSAKNQNLYDDTYFYAAALALEKAYQLVNDNLSERAKVILKTKYLLQARGLSASLIFHDFHENKSGKELMQKALLKLDSARAIPTKSSDALLNHTYALTLQALGNYSQAINYEMQVLSLAPAWKYPYNTLGYLYSKNGNQDSAIYYYKKCIELDAQYKTAYNNLGLLYMNQNNLEQASVYLSQCLRIDPNYINARLNTGLLYYKKRMTDSAEYYYRSCIQLDSNFSNGHFNLGILYYNKKDYPSAITSFNKCVQADKNFSKAYFGLACIYSAQNNMALAAKNMELALSSGYKDKKAIEANMDLAAFRQTSEYSKLLKKYLPE